MCWGFIFNNYQHLPITKWFLSVSPCLKCEGLFSIIYSRNLVDFLEIILWGPSCDWVPLEFLTSRGVCMEPPAIPHYSSGFPYLAPIPWQFLPESPLWSAKTPHIHSSVSPHFVSCSLPLLGIDHNISILHYQLPCHCVRYGSANYCLWAKSVGLGPVFANKMVLQHSHVYSFIYCPLLSTGELSSYNRDHIIFNA